MTGDLGSRTMLGLGTVLLVLAALYLARPVFAPIAFALFIVAIVWPFQRALQIRLPTFLALTLTILVTLIAVTALASLVAWGFTRVGQWVIGNGARFQMLYAQMAESLERHGVVLATLWAEQFNVRWLIRILQEVTGRIQSLFSFIIVTLVFTILGLLEVGLSTRKLQALKNRQLGRTLLQAGTETAAKLQKYMLVRTLMSVMTGLVIWAFALVAGLDLALEWGVIAFSLNYIPFIGPLIATIFPTVFAAAQFGSWEMPLVVFLCLNIIQFLLGSYLEPRFAGATLSISPFVVLFAVFFWSFLWGVPGAFIGVPVVIACLTVCDQYPATRWIAELLSASDSRPDTA